ncbi:hypothetical protein F4775DRAFT_367065 [Biscogniauxia sp. FL1348]|nr:hypothetical protein F4775DRAFT_367065 [Biscogniauxia sp. FL1348]
MCMRRGRGIILLCFILIFRYLSIYSQFSPLSHHAHPPISTYRVPNPFRSPFCLFPFRFSFSTTPPYEVAK